MANREYNASNSFESTLSASLGAGDTTINVTTTDGTPGVPFYVVIDPDDDSKREIVGVDQGKTGTTFTLSSAAQRGLDGTTDVAHDANAVIGIYPINAYWEDIHDRVDQHAHGGGSDGAQVDHGALGGLGDDDHTQYLNGTRHDARDHSTALGTAAFGDLSDGATLQNAVDDVAAILTAAEDYVDPSETTTSTSYTDLATAGPAVTITTGTTAIVSIGAGMRADGTAGDQALMGFEVSGASAIPPNSDDVILNANTEVIQAGLLLIVTGLTAGSNTFTAKYRTTAGTARFSNRRITVVPLGD